VVEAVDRRRGGSEGTSAGMERLVVEAREGRCKGFESSLCWALCDGEEVHLS